MLPKDKVHVLLEAVEKHKKKSFFERLKEIAPIITSLAALLLSGVSIWFVHTQDTEKTDLAILDVRQKALAGAGETEEIKQDIAASTLALYRPDLALPAIRLLLIGSWKTAGMRKFGVLAAGRWIQAGDERSRRVLLEELVYYARSDVTDLRQGAYAAISSVCERLNPAEKDRVLQLVKERLGTGEQAAETDTDALREACGTLNCFPFAQSRSALRNVAKTAAVDEVLSAYQQVVKQPLNATECRGLLSDLGKIGPTEKIKEALAKTIVDAQEKCK
jgi:hypothetical protein